MAQDNLRIGTTAELAVAAKLNSLGYTVSWPLSVSPFDLIATKGKYSKRVQVKTGDKRTSGAYRIHINKGRLKKSAYTKEDCSSIVVYVPYLRDYNNEKEDGFYVIPVEATSKSMTCIIYPPGKGTHPHWVSKWEKYRNAWGKL